MNQLPYGSNQQAQDAVMIKWDASVQKAPTKLVGMLGEKDRDHLQITVYASKMYSIIIPALTRPSEQAKRDLLLEEILSKSATAELVKATVQKAPRKIKICGETIEANAYSGHLMIDTAEYYFSVDNSRPFRESILRRL